MRRVHSTERRPARRHDHCRGGDAADHAHGHPTTPRRPPPLFAYCAAVALVTLVGKAGDVMGPVWVGTGYERWLLSLNANDLHCVLTTSPLGTWEWFALCTTRRMIEDPLFFWLGRHHGERAVAWLREKVPGAAKAETVLKHASVVGVAIDPGAIVCTMAGVHRMAPLTFFAANFIGTIARLVLLRILAAAFPNQLEYVVETVRYYQTTAVVLAVVLVSCSSWKLLNPYTNRPPQDPAGEARRR